MISINNSKIPFKAAMESCMIKSVMQKQQVGLSQSIT